MFKSNIPTWVFDKRSLRWYDKYNYPARMFHPYMTDRRWKKNFIVHSQETMIVSCQKKDYFNGPILLVEKRAIADLETAKC